VLALVIVAISVGLDNFGAAAAMGMAGLPRHHFARVVATFAVIEAIFPVLGILLGRSVAGSIGANAKLYAGLVLCAVGAYTIGRELLAPESESKVSRPRSFAHLVVLGSILSIDNFAIGFALGATKVSIVVAFVVLGVVSALLALLGLELGARLGRRTGRWSEALGGLLLLGVGAAIAAGF